MIRGYEDNGVFTAGGISTSHSLLQTYGTYDVRFRIDDGSGVAYAILLWPATGSGPPEVDFAEDNGAPTRASTYATVHWRANGVAEQESQLLPGDFTQWHTLGVVWTPGSLIYTIDGQEWASVTGASVPSTPMALCIQSQAWSGTYNNPWENPMDLTTPGEVDMDVAWAVAYSYTPGSN